MRISHWLTRLQDRPLRRTRRAKSQQVTESLEQRTLLTIIGVPISPTELTIFADDGDSVTVQRNSTSGEVEVLDATMQPVAAIPTFQASTLTALNIFAGDADNTIDVSPLTSVEFPALTTIVMDSGDGDDVITGSADFAELIDADDGNDTITGNGGDDTIDAGDGNDVVTGGAGVDSILGGDGQDTIDGGDGNDNIDAGDGQDSVDGGDGDDMINAGDGLDTVNGGAGDDNINGMSGTDLLNGDADNDTILGGSENDIVNGGSGNDIVNGQAGNDTVSGDAGDDTAYGGGGRDSLLGGDGDDIINGQSGNDTLNGEAGSDRAYGGSGNDSLDGGGDNDTLRGHSGNDTLDGGVGDDNMDGGSGNDLLFEEGIVVLPTLSISDAAAVDEGDMGTVTTTFTVTLSSASTSIVTVSFATGDGSAMVADSDYVTIPITPLTFAPGVTVQTVTVTVNGDTQIEATEFFFGELTSPVGATLFDPIGLATITDDDTSFRLVGTGFLTGEIFEVDRNTAASTLIGSTGFSQFHGLTRGPGSRIFGVHQAPALRLLDVDPVTATATVIGALNPAPSNSVEGDLAYNLTTDILYASFSGPDPNLFEIDPATGATTDLGDLLTGGTPLSGGGIDIDAIAFRNGELYAVISSGLTGVDAPLNNSLLRIDLATREVTSVGPLGVTLALGTSGLAYDSENDVFVLVNGNVADSTLYEVDVQTGAATVIGSTGVSVMSGLLFQQSPAPNGVSVLDASVTEGDSGTVSATFTVTLDRPEVATTTVQYTTVDSNAVAGTDYTADADTITFAPGITTQTVTIDVLGDQFPEPNEVFFLRLSAPSGMVVLGNPVAVGTILNDDVDTSADTFLGGTGNDTIIAQNGDDVINGGSGNDSISGGADDDSIDGGDGNDTIDGGSGDDTIAGQGGDDVITAGAGIDLVIWDGLGNGVDTILVSDGAETLTVQGDSGVNNFTVDSNGGLLRVTEGAASITVATSTTTVNVNGGSEADVITIGELVEVNPLVLNIDGQADNDTITAADANIGDVRMFLNGGTGNDTITGSRDGDSINGDGGDDSVLGGLGDDTVDGGEGNDILNGEAGNDSLLGNTGNDLMDGGDGDDILSGSLGNDTAIGGLGNDSLFGGFGADVLNGNSGNDLADGGRDNDQVLGGSGDDSLKGGTGDDTVRGQSGSDLIKGGDGDDRILGESGNDVIDAGDGDDNIDAGNGNDIATGGDGNDTINGMSGTDTLLGGNGADNQIGGAGIDSLYGEEGDDSLNGGGSTDQFNGGEGVDVLVSPDAGEVDNNNLAVSASVLEALELLNGF